MAYTIEEIKTWDKRGRVEVNKLLHGEGINPDRNTDYTCAIFDEGGTMLATGSCFCNSLRCLAVRSDHRGEGLLNKIISHLVDYEAQRGYFHLFVYTKPENARIFRDLGFYEIVTIDGSVSFLENRSKGFRSYCTNLKKGSSEAAAIVMNANPFTMGHRHLAEQAAREVGTLHLFVVEEDASLIPYKVRRELVERGTAHLSNVIIHGTGPYIISAATFPSYFIREAEAVTQSHAMLDAILFCTVAEALDIKTRFVGTEPLSRSTAIYNEVLARELPRKGIELRIVQRCEKNGAAVSASLVRQLIHEGKLSEIKTLVPETTWQYFNSSDAGPIIEVIRNSNSIIHA